jgi:aminoglycoside 3-N-acetyltransferase
MSLEYSLRSLIKSIPSKNIYIASDFRKILYQSKQDCSYYPEILKDTLELLIKNLGPDYTIVIPTFNWGFCNKVDYDFKNTKSETGIFSQAALISNGFKRTRHPIYSFAVYGKQTDKFLGLANKKSFGENSPFELLYEYDFYFLAIDVSFNNSFTYAHHVEQIYDVPYRFEKDFVSNYVDENGKKEERIYSMFVRDIHKGITTNLNSFFVHLNSLGLVFHGSLDISKYYYLRIIDVHNEIVKEIINNNGSRLHDKKI